jgi:hypothetical protein
MTTTRLTPADNGHTGALATAYGHGIACGCAAASADSPDFLADQALIYAAWEVSCAGEPAQPQDEQEEYFIAWVRGYVVCAEQLEDAASAGDEGADA